VVAFDRGKPAFRVKALAQYKVHRPPTAESLRAQFSMVKELLGALDVPVVEVDGWEGDDILGTVARRGEAAGLEVLLVTGDRDAFQLVSQWVKVVTTRKGITDIVVYGPQEVLERYGITSLQVPDYLGLKGDTSDNIPGVPGVGEKTAARLLQRFGTLEAVLEAAKAGEIPGKVGLNLVEHEGAALASRTVATIACDVPFDIDLEQVRFGEFEPATVAKAFAELRFTSALDRVLALRAGSEQTSSTGAADPPPLEVRAACDLHSCLHDREAETAVWAWLSGDRNQWLGVAVGVPVETLFADTRDLAVAGPEAIALFSGEAFDAVLLELLGRGRVAAGDVKALIQEACPPDEALPGVEAALDADPSRLFDCGIAAYLLESNRSSYELASLHADYLSAPLNAASDTHPDAAVLAQAAADLCPELERRLTEDGSLAVMRDIEMPLVGVLARMEREGVGVDTGVLAGMATETRARTESLRSEIFSLAGCEFTIDSPKQLSEVLFEKMGLPTGKRTKTGYSTDAGVLSSLAPIHPIAEKIVAYRELTKLNSTYIEALPRLLGQDGRLHTSFNQTVAATGRLSSSNPNLQNIPVRTEFGRRIRAAFVPAGASDVMVSADYSQIELRVLAHLSEDEGLIDAFTSGMDFHQATAARVFGVSVDDVEPGMRARAKAVNFGIVYGQTAHGLGDSLKIGYGEAQAMIDRYYEAYPRVRSYLDETVVAAHRDGYAVTMFGRKRRIPELLSSNHNVRSFGERTAMNHPMQGTAADIMKLAMIEVDRKLRAAGMGSRMVLQVHDELVFEAPVSEVVALTALVSEAMSGVVELRVPLDVSVASGTDWASAK
jgi:DNA polymerase-1